MGRQRFTMIYDRIPEGTVEVRHVSEVVSSDDHVIGHDYVIGHADGIVIDANGHITHMVSIMAIGVAAYRIFNYWLPIPTAALSYLATQVLTERRVSAVSVG